MGKPSVQKEGENGSSSGGLVAPRSQQISGLSPQCQTKRLPSCAASQRVQGNRLSSSAKPVSASTPPSCLPPPRAWAHSGGARACADRGGAWRGGRGRGLRGRREEARGSDANAPPVVGVFAPLVCSFWIPFPRLRRREAVSQSLTSIDLCVRGSCTLLGGSCSNQAHVASLEGHTTKDKVVLLAGSPPQDEATLGPCGVEALATLEVVGRGLGEVS
ncbi:uncharacterized protein LOC125079894 [Lutra lutra]|uniref:uncharacterized protein LOC125079894 n=1 Tax=Lutra lutra TaxID=9657 RepID=UPI001FD0C313|nr:uncharacterized protein LOC125079894 [Lutra lutra]